MNGMRTLTAILALLLAACAGGGTGGGTDPGGGGPSWHATALGTSWSALATNVRLASEGEGSLEVGADGVPFAGYADLDGHPHVRRWSGTDWPLLGTLPAGTGAYGEIAVARAPSGEPAAFWIEPDVDYRDEVRGARFTGGAWTDVGAPANDLLANPSTYFVHAASGAKGPVVAWTGLDAASADTAWVARLGASGWVALGGAKPLAIFGDVSVATTAQGDPVVAYVDPVNAAVVERWSDASGWESLPPTPATFDLPPEIEVAVDGTGAIYTVALWTEGYHLQIDAVYRLAPGAASWTSLGKPPGFTSTYTRVSLAGLPGGGVVAAWAYADAGVARYVNGAWESIRSPSTSGYGGRVRPMIAVAGDDDVFVAFDDILNAPTMSVSRYQRY